MENESFANTVFAIAHSYRLAMRTALKANETGLNAMHVQCLSFIEKQQSCTANDIVNHFLRDKGQIARLIKEMLDKKWLNKSAHPKDKRSALLSLSAEGKVLAARITEAQSDIQKKMQKNLSTEELQEFTRIAAIISANLEGAGAAE